MNVTNVNELKDLKLLEVLGNDLKTENGIIVIGDEREQFLDSDSFQVCKPRECFSKPNLFVIAIKSELISTIGNIKEIKTAP